MAVVNLDVSMHTTGRSARRPVVTETEAGERRTRSSYTPRILYGDYACILTTGGVSGSDGGEGGGSKPILGSVE